MQLSDAQQDRKVVYTPYNCCDPKLKKEGVITSIGDVYVYVRYGSDLVSKATLPKDIKYINRFKKSIN
jgi:hypothetical protein